MGQLFSSPAQKGRRKGQRRRPSSNRSYKAPGSTGGRPAVVHASSELNGRNGSHLGPKHSSHKKLERPTTKKHPKKPTASRPSQTSRTISSRVGEADRTKSRTHKSKQTKSQASKGKSSVKVTELKDCLVCTDARSLHRFPSRPPTQFCTHQPDVCRRCLRTWIQSEFSTKMWNEIACPICLSHMQHDDIQLFAPHDIFRRYDKLNTKAACEAIPNFRWCMARGCKAGQVHDPSHTRFRCKTCRKSHCINHNSTWHRGETCAEYDYRTNKGIKRAEEIASKRCIEETTKKCPGCKRSIEKSSGCDHMTCSRCKHEFCWQCLAPYLKKGARRVVHREGCEYNDPQWEMML